MGRKVKMKAKLFAVLLAVAVLFTGCFGVSQEEYDAAVAERDAAISERDKAVSAKEKADKRHTKALSNLETERDELESQVAALELEKEELLEQRHSLEDGQSASTDSSESDKLYADLDTLISSPETLDSSLNDYLDEEITFTAVVLSDPEEWEFDEEDGGTQLYVWAAISRNDYDELLINIDSIPEADYPADGDIIIVTGAIEGTIYSIEDGEQSDFIDFMASEITPIDPDFDPDTANKITVGRGSPEGEISFVSAERTKDSFGDVVLLYFEFTNTGDTSIAPATGEITFYQGDNLLTTSIHSVDAALDSSALDATMLPGKTAAGKTSLYYTVLTPDDSSQSITGEEIEAYRWDDEFNCTNMVFISIDA